MEANAIEQPPAPTSTSSTPPSLITSGSLGEAVEVSNTTVVVALNQNAQKAAVKIGEVLILEGSSMALVGEVDNISASHTPRGIETRAHVSIIATLHPKKAILTAGVSDSPILKGRAFRPHPAVVKAVIEDRHEVFADTSTQLSLELAHPANYPNIELAFSPEKILGRHCAVLGTSGAGKSWSVARIVEQCAKHRAKLILLDPTGEYETLNEGVFHVHLGNATRDTARSREASLPYSELTEADLVAIFRPNAGNQLVKLRSAIKTLKLLHLQPRLGTDGTMIKAHKSKVAFEAAYQVSKADVDRPENLFAITKLPLQLEYECVEPTRSQTEIDYWGGTNAHDHSQCVPLINRMSDILGAEELRCIFFPSQKPSIFDVITKFFDDESVSVLRISFEFLPSLHRTREIVANALGRFLLAHGRRGEFRKRPLVVLLDEAHQALNSRLSDLSVDFPLEAFNIIAKEGRKYALTLCLATQRPRDIPDDVMSQVGTFVAHRLVNDQDRATIERASGTCNQNLLAHLPSLGPGEAFILGIDFATPLRVRMIAPAHAPISRGPDYQNLWKR
jgi:DNA helicase HerA-like ATPase